MKIQVIFIITHTMTDFNRILNLEEINNMTKYQLSHWACGSALYGNWANVERIVRKNHLSVEDYYTNYEDEINLGLLDCVVIFCQQGDYQTIAMTFANDRPINPHGDLIAYENRMGIYKFLVEEGFTHRVPLNDLVRILCHAERFGRPTFLLGLANDALKASIRAWGRKELGNPTELVEICPDLACELWFPFLESYKGEGDKSAYYMNLLTSIRSPSSMRAVCAWISANEMRANLFSRYLRSLFGATDSGRYSDELYISFVYFRFL